MTMTDTDRAGNRWRRASHSASDGVSCFGPAACHLDERCESGNRLYDRTKPYGSSSLMQLSCTDHDFREA